MTTQVHKFPHIGIVTNPRNLLSISKFIVQKNQQQLALFAKYWEPGKVKTRLAAETGKVEASEIYRVFLNTLLRRFDTTANQRTIVYSPPASQSEFESIAKESWTLHPQTAGGLGERLIDFCKTAFQSTTKPTSLVIIGSDCLDVDSQIIEQAFLALSETDVVLGPSLDGGYYLIGMSRYAPSLFHEIAWSTEAVYSQTLQRIQDEGLSLTTLPQLNDIDEAKDLNEFMQRLENQMSQDLGDSKLLAEIQSALAIS